MSEQDKLVGLIYEAVLTPALWPQLLDQMKHYLNTSSELVECMDKETMLLKERQQNALGDHFKRAVSIQQKISQLESVTHALASILNRLPVGVVLVRQDATVIISNTLASDVMHANHHLSIHHGQLLAQSAVSTRELHDMIGAAFAANGSMNEQDISSMMSVGAAGQEISVWVTASIALPTSLQAGEVFAAVFMHSAKIQRTIPLTAFIMRYHISPAESRLETVMLNGCHTLNDAAMHLGISKHTARAQMKSILGKTGCNSQTELIKKILIDPTAMMLEQNTDSVSKHTLKLSHVDAHQNEYLSMYLHDGRRLVWKEFGLATGRPVMVFHSLTGAHPDYQVATEMGLRLIVPERPGAHGSEPLHGRDILDWAADVEELADHLELEKFALIGFSAGTPYVLACVHSIPHRISNVILLATMAPVGSEDDLIGMLPLNHQVMRLAHNSPALLLDFMKVFLKELEQNPQSYFTNVANDQPRTDIAILNQAETKTQLLQAFQAAAKENLQQLCDEITLCASNWPVDCSRYKGKTSIWHGLDDPLVPIHMGKRIAAMLENPKVYWLEGVGNYLVYSHWKEILSELEC